MNIGVKGGSSEEGGFAGVRSIVWDGKDFVIDTSLGGGSAIYRISIKNKRGRTVGTTYLGGSAGTLGKLAIYNGNSQGAQVVGGGGETSGSLVDYWKYPSGGSPFAQITNGLDGPFGVAISLKGRRSPLVPRAFAPKHCFAIAERRNRGSAPRTRPLTIGGTGTRIALV